jgi:hypothetical protein
MRLFHTLIFLAATTATMAVLPQAANAQADRVCKEVCSGGVCRQDCIRTEGRGDRTEDRREERREERREDRRGPGIDLRIPVPVPDIRVGPPPPSL